ncbi:protease modulator HflC [Sphingomonas swuensis]|uniref:Protein HflC n=1 Tax=Sphingomonas swuensis TaxID=977800 RepID=A0ABP7SFC7_9SPHN
MIDAILRRPLFSGIIALLVLVTILSSVKIVPETSQAIIVRFGKPERILNRYQANAPIGGPGAGIAVKVPFVDDIVWIDKRVRDVDMERQMVLSTDQLRLEVDAFARYRVVDPLRMYIRARSEERVGEALRPILGSELRNELGKRPFADLLSPERQGAMENIRRGLDRIARQYGVQIIDVRIKRADLPSGTPLESAYERMRTAREQEARSIRAEGSKQAQIIRAEADASAARTYANSFGKDPAFYDFYRAMQAYDRTFTSKSKPTNVILSPQNEFLREFTSGGGR